MLQSSETDVIDDPQPTIEQVLNCQIHVWYRAHRRWTIRSRLIDLSPEFVQYLNQDGFFLPPGAELQRLRGKRYDDDSCSSSSESSWSSDEDDGDRESRRESESSSAFSDGDSVAAALPAFVEIEQIRDVIEELGGAVFPKLNWSCPKDAKWISCTGTLRCVSPSDVLLLLKASEFVQHDLTQPFEACAAAETTPDVSYKLCLRQWAYVAPSREFRCFVIDRELRAISQRDEANFYPNLNEPGVVDDLRDRISRFFQQRIVDAFPDRDFVFDACLDGDDNVFLVDFNPFSPVTDSLLFTWPELYDWHRNGPEPGAVEFRIRTSEPAMTPTSTMSYGFPKDVVHVGSAAEIDEFVELARSLRAEGKQDR